MERKLYCVLSVVVVALREENEPLNRLPFFLYQIDTSILEPISLKKMFLHKKGMKCFDIFSKMGNHSSR